tara:strand:+ start:666 stop:899 length:234 start_codon:yes stop_codon:yes gene_type:complete
MSATKWAHSWVVRKIQNDDYYDAVQTLEMAALIQADAEAASVKLEVFLKKIAPTTLEQYLEDTLDDTVNIEDQVLTA